MSPRRVVEWAAAGMLALGAFAACSNGAKQSLEDADTKVVLCHFTSGGHYNVSSVSKQAVINGDTGHQGHGNDVIPPFTYRQDGQQKTFPGLNYQGQVDGSCNPTAPTTTKATTTTRAPTTTTTTATESSTTTSTTEPTGPPITEGPIVGPTDETGTSEGQSTTSAGDSTTTVEGGETTTTGGSESSSTVSRIPQIPVTTIVVVTNPDGSTVTTTGGKAVSVPAVVATNPDGSTVTDANGDAEVLGIVITNPDGTPATDASGGLVTLPVQQTIARTGSDSSSLVPAGLFFIALGCFAIGLMGRLRRLPRG